MLCSKECMTLRRPIQCRGSKRYPATACSKVNSVPLKLVMDECTLLSKGGCMYMYIPGFDTSYQTNAVSAYMFLNFHIYLFNICKLQSP
ncbi:hypothetical protein I7I48_09913 [Histoplasma ohiense]|nr:hypothetical protein I7I48_09913 [Histoplasma ohiense (nom. inval.)]